jgi:hypothetical protein
VDTLSQLFAKLIDLVGTASDLLFLVGDTGIEPVTSSV